MKISIPIDSWGICDDGPVTPRRWQSEALPIFVNHFNKQNPSRAVIHAVTGSGKARLIAQFAACIRPGPDEVIVVSTSRQKLVRQIRYTIKDRLEGDNFMAEEVVGAYFADCKDLHCSVIICCNDSMIALAEALQKIGKGCCFWICDELHRSESKRMKTAYEKLAPTMACGLSATPYRASVKQGISNFDEVIYKYTIQDALADKNVIVPWITKAWEGDETDLDSACITMMKEEHGRGICNAVSIDDAVLFAKLCTENGLPAKAVHSKMTDKDVDDTIEELRVGTIQVVIHVDLLTEGVDIPWIEFLCLRRVVASRNRFVQELGRGIRYYIDKITGKEKQHLTVLDPHDLISVHKLTHEAVLSGDFDPDDLDDDNEDPGKKLERTLQQECFKVLKHLTQVKAGKEPMRSEPLASYLSQLCSVFDTFGLMEKPLASREWRRAPASQKQVQSMQNLKWSLSRKQVPTMHRTALEILTGHGTVMNRGMCSDLISIEMSLAEKSKWPKFEQLDKVVKDGLERHTNRKSRPKTEFKAVTQQPGRELEQGVLFDTGKKK